MIIVLFEVILTIENIFSLTSVSAKILNILD